MQETETEAEAKAEKETQTQTQMKQMTRQQTRARIRKYAKILRGEDRAQRSELAGGRGNPTQVRSWRDFYPASTIAVAADAKRELERKEKVKANETSKD